MTDSTTNLFSNTVLIFIYIKIVMLIFISFVNIFILIKNRNTKIINKYVQILFLFVWFYLIFDNVESVLRYYGLEYFYDEVKSTSTEILFQSEIEDINTNIKIDSIVGRIYDDIEIQKYKDSIDIEK